MAQDQRGAVHHDGVADAFQLNDGPRLEFVSFKLAFGVNNCVVLCAQHHRLEALGDGKPMNDRALVASLDALHPCLVVVKRYVSKFLETKVHFFEVLALQPNSTVAQFPRSQAHGWMVGVNGDVQLVGVVANQFKFNSVANERQPWCIVVDGVCVVRIQGGQRYRDVLLGDAQFGPEVPQCFRLNAAIAQAR